VLRDSINSIKKLQSRKKITAFVGYAILMGIAFVVMPPNPDKINTLMELVNGFRVMSVITVSIFWASLSAILDVVWHKFRPYSQIKLETH
jgi:predicted cobalt transporter CbtA